MQQATSGVDMAAPPPMKRALTRQATMSVVQVHYPGDEYLPGRARMRKFFDDIKTEFFVTGLVLLNMLMLLVDMVVTDDQGRCNIYGNATVIRSCIEAVNKEPFFVSWMQFFDVLELSFLSLFASEILARLYAYGPSYFMNVLNAFDATIVSLLFILQILVMAVFQSGNSSFSFLRIVRLVRLVRLFVVMNKVEKAQRAYKKAKYMRLGSPVERVMELLGDMKGKLEETDDAADVAWIMHLIASDKLYTIDIRSAGGANLSAEMEWWLENNMGMKKDMDKLGADGDGFAASAGQKALGLKRAETKVNMGDASSGAARELTRLDEVLMMPEMEYYLSAQPGRSHIHLHDWDVDLFDFAAKCKGSHLVVGVEQLLEEYGLISKFRLSKHRLLTFLRRIQDGYVPENPYHNSLHALDVVLNTNFFCRTKLISDLITPLDRLATIIASAIHDFNHPGLNGNFLQATKHEYAITYNDQSILESMHVASAFRVLLQDDCNFLKGLSKEQYLEFRDTVIQLVLGTDMKYHFEHYTKFKTKVSSDTFAPGCEREDVKFLLAVAMHTGDIANCAKPLKTCLQWTELVMEEFFRQGDLEAKLGMPISPFYDREKTSIAACQVGFINVLVKPLYAEFTSLVGEPALSSCYGPLEANLRGWEAHGNDLLKMGGVTPMDGGGFDHDDAKAVSSGPRPSVLGAVAVADAGEAANAGGEDGNGAATEPAAAEAAQ